MGYPARFRRLARVLGVLLLPWGMAIWASCSEPPVPRPAGYPRIDFPEKAYRLLDSIAPFSFELPTYAEFTARGDGMGYNISVGRFGATVYLTYYDRPAALDTLFEDAHTMAYKHTIRASTIDEVLYEDTARDVYSILYRIGGDVASNVQFYATDSVRHFLRGSLYFYCTPNIDSLAPAVDFFEADVRHLIETLEWKEVPSCPR